MNPGSKVLIVDWDLHYGDGSARLLMEDPSIMLMSLHKYAHGEYYPGPVNAGRPDIVGNGPAAGTIVNIPFNESGTGDAEYQYAFEKVLIPIARQFGPDLIIISAGFDAAAGDKLGDFKLTPDCYAWMTNELLSV